MEKPKEKWKCRACGTEWEGKQLYQSTRHANTWTCGDLFCGGTCDPIKENSGESVK